MRSKISCSSVMKIVERAKSMNLPSSSASISKTARSCQTPAGRAVGKQVQTVEGNSGPVVDAVRAAWHRENVVQCGYCQPGQTLAAVALLESNPSPSDAVIARWMNGNLCRCGTYPRIQKAIHAAASSLVAGERPAPLAAPPEVEVELADIPPKLPETCSARTISRRKHSQRADFRP